MNPLLGLCFPIIGKLIKDKNERRSWQVASEHQLLSHLKRNKIKVIGYGLTGGIRRLNVEKLNDLIETLGEDLKNLTILYGIEGNYTDVTATYMSKISNKEMYGSFSSMFGDPIPGRQKHIIIEHLHGRFKIDD